MRIVLFSPTLMTGGAERVMVTLANWLVAHNQNVKILTIKMMDSLYAVDKRVEIKAAGLSWSKSTILKAIQAPFAGFRALVSFVKNVNHFEADVVLSFLFLPNILSVISRKHIKAPVIISERNDPNVERSALRRVLRRFFYPKAERIICQGIKVSEFFQAWSAKCVVLPNPLNSAAVGAFVQEKKKRIVAVGRLVPQKNHKLLIEAFSKIHTTHKDYILEIFGEGVLKNELEQMINQLGLRGSVLIHDNVKNVMNKVNDAACFVLPSDYEGMPNVLIEAMASGMPVVSTDFWTGIARELIVDGVNGYLVPVGDADRMAEAIEKIISSEDLQRHMGLANLKVREMFDEDKICSQWEAFLCRMVESRK